MAISPGAFDQHPACMSVPRLGDGAKMSLVATGVLAGNEAEISHKLPGIIETGQISHFGHDGHGHDELDATERLKSLHYWIELPGCGEFFQLGLDMSESFRVLCDGADIFLKDDLLGRRWANNRGEPTQVRFAPVRRTGVTDVETQKKGF